MGDSPVRGRIALLLQWRDERLQIEEVTAREISGFPSIFNLHFLFFNLQFITPSTRVTDHFVR
jgi:hypothetical protein